MHDYNTIIGVIGLRNDNASYPVIRRRYGIGNSGIAPDFDPVQKFRSELEGFSETGTLSSGGTDLSSKKRQEG